MTATSDKITVRRIGGDDAAACVPALAELLKDCVDGGASVGFMHPMTAEKALRFWRSVAEGVARGERALLVAENGDVRIIGTAQLILAQPENQPHRAPDYSLMPDGPFCPTTIFYKAIGR